MNRRESVDMGMEEKFVERLYFNAKIAQQEVHYKAFFFNGGDTLGVMMPKVFNFYTISDDQKENYRLMMVDGETGKDLNYSIKDRILDMKGKNPQIYFEAVDVRAPRCRNPIASNSALLEDDEEEEEDEGTGAKSGILSFKANEKDKKTKTFWFTILGSTLFGYKTMQHEKPELTVQLKATKVIELQTPKHSVLVQDAKQQTLVLLLLMSDPDMASWAAAIRGCVSLPPEKAPEKEKRTRRSTMSMRLKKTVAGKVATTGAGKSLAKSSVPEEVQELMKSLKNILIHVEGPGPAGVIEDNIMKLLVKCFFLEENNQITVEDFLKLLYKSVRGAFTNIIKLRSEAKHADDLLQKIVHNLSEMDKGLTKLLTPYMKPSNAQRIAVVFSCVGDHEFLRKALVKPDKAIADDVGKLVVEMEKYLKDTQK